MARKKIDGEILAVATFAGAQLALVLLSSAKGAPTKPEKEPGKGKIPPDLEESIDYYATMLGMGPGQLRSIIGFETGDTFRPDVVNRACLRKYGDDWPLYCAVGLIQFYPGRRYATTGKLGAGQGVVGKTGPELAAMSATEQMQYVYEYLEKGKKSFIKKKGREPETVFDWYSIVNPGFPQKTRKALAAYGKRRGWL